MLQAFFSDSYEVGKLPRWMGHEPRDDHLAHLPAANAPGIASIAIIYAFISAPGRKHVRSGSDPEPRQPDAGRWGWPHIGQYQVDWALLLPAQPRDAPVLVLFSFVGRSFIEGHDRRSNQRVSRLQVCTAMRKSVRMVNIPG